MKISAAVMILISTLMMLYSLIRNENRHVHDLKSAINIMTDIKNYAIHYLLPFDVVVKNYVVDKNINNIDYLNAFLADSESSTPQAWKTAVTESKAVMTDNEKEKLITFGESLCHCSKEQISEYAEKYIRELTEIYEMLNDNREKKIKTVSALTLSAGLMVILLLV